MAQLYLQQINLISQLVDAFLRPTNAGNFIFHFRYPAEQLWNVLFAQGELLNDRLLLMSWENGENKKLIRERHKSHKSWNR